MATLTARRAGRSPSAGRSYGISAPAPAKSSSLDMLPGGRVALRAAHAKGSIDDFIGALKGKSSKIATLDEIDEAIASGWTGET